MCSGDRYRFIQRDIDKIRMCLPSILHPLTLPSASSMGDHKQARSSRPPSPPGFRSLTLSQGILSFGGTSPWGSQLRQAPGEQPVRLHGQPQSVSGGGEGSLDGCGRAAMGSGAGLGLCRAGSGTWSPASAATRIRCPQRLPGPGQAPTRG